MILALALFRAQRAVTLQDGIGRGIGFLQVDTPVFEFFQRDCDAGDGTANECTRPHHAEFAIEIFDFRLARHGR